MLVLDGAQEIYNSPGWLVFQADGEEAEAGADEAVDAGHVHAAHVD